MPTVRADDNSSLTRTPSPQIDFVRPEVKKLLPIYERIDDCIEGQAKVKEKGETYLPNPTPINSSMTDAERLDSVERYKNYLSRALFYNMTDTTIKGLEGQLFLRDPAMDEPLGETLKYIMHDIDGNNNGLFSHAKKTCNYVLRHGRCFLWTDYPDVKDAEGNVKQASKADNENGTIRGTTHRIKAKHGINWRITKRGGKWVLSRFVFKRKYVVDDDGYSFDLEDEWVILALDDSFNYYTEVWRKGENVQFEKFSGPDYVLNSEGKNLDEIPLDIIGSMDNEHLPNKPPVQDLVDINFAHYVNSADYEESAHILGQPTPYYSGITESWIENVFKNRTVLLGSRAAIPLPEGAEAGLLQADENTMIFAAMQHKEKQAKALGSKMVEDREVQRTATEATSDNISENSELSKIAKNVSVAYRSVLNRHATFMNMSLIRENTEDSFVINTDFEVNNVGPDQVRTWLELYEKFAITWNELRFKLRRAGIAIEDDEDAKVAIDKMMQDKQKAAMDLVTAKSAKFEDNKDPKEGDPKA